MRRSSTAFSKALLATALILPGVVLAAASRPYVIFTHDGHRVLAESKPRVEGLEAYVRLLPGRQLAVMKEEQIDWKRTEAANAGLEPVAIPSGSTFVERPAARRKPITHTIVGKPTPGNQDVPAGQTPEDTLRAQLASANEQRQQHQSRRQALLEELQTLETAGAAAAGGDDQRASRVNELRKSITDLNEAILKLNAEIEALEKEAAVQGGKLN